MFRQTSQRVWIVLLLVSSGCSLLPHELQPTQLRKLNRGPALGRDTTNFSIPDPEIPDGFAKPKPGEDPFLQSP